MSHSEWEIAVINETRLFVVLQGRHWGDTGSGRTWWPVLGAERYPVVRGYMYYLHIDKFGQADGQPYGRITRFEVDRGASSASSVADIWIPPQTSLELPPEPEIEARFVEIRSRFLA